ncbi:hypothetical protein [Pseudanabaena mucicola]|uniref:SLH domain-containing protein n=1 Tax=Pseudanabaena mucicola FACHB-723 TaxID=2692860 RepID=A0ABR8A3R5_9CYAN|nr:hypothetical protein [Pseudanabaena mucicola]MBD2189946.1 hypothetical protein [Pseudanabaena mucicola FACHB-723]
MKLRCSKIWQLARISLVSGTAIYLAACQGSNLGSSLETAIAPAPSDTPEVVSPTPVISKTPIVTTQPTIETTTKPTTKTTTSTNPPITSVISIDLAKLKSIALGSETLTVSPVTNISIKSLFDIDFSKAPPPVKQFSDLDTAPAPLRGWISDLYQLGTITPKTGQEFKPNILVARREYARWLLETNNRLYKNQPSRQIRLAQPTEKPIFVDVPNQHPDFAVIQGLANAGLIGSSDRFFPGEPLSRQELVQWKIPLDLRQPLPRATLENIRQSWGFQDSDRISDDALSAIFADAQLRDISNIRRSFGFTTLLQPQKPVTRAEAAASLWYFGTATDGISASRALDLQK